MTIKTAFVVTLTAAAITLGSLAAPAPAAASPFGAFKTNQIETELSGVETVGKRWRKKRRRNAAAIGALGIIGLTGALIANQAAHARQRCFIEEVEYWDRYRQAYVIEEREVCR
ncbi:MAG: hypothetical protein AAF318_04825 [Pseudomonadota bacterium]